MPGSVCGGEIFLAVLLPVIGIAGAPFSGAVPADFAVLGIDGNFGAVKIGATTALAVNSAADSLAALELRRLEDLLAVEATPFTHMNGVVSSRRPDSTGKSLETAVDCLPRPRQWPSVKTGGIADVSDRR